MSDIVDDFINKVRAPPALQGGPWPRRIDDFEKALQALFISDNERASKCSMKFEAPSSASM
jgi:hypothetical protein